MNKYELALVVSAKIEDDARTATVEKAKEYITRAGGNVTEVEEAGKKKLAYEIQKMSCLCHRRRSDRSPHQPDSGGVSHRKQGKGDEPAAFVLLLGTYGRGTAVYGVFRPVWRGKLEDSHLAVGTGPGLQYDFLCNCSVVFAPRRGRKRAVSGGIVPAEDFLDLSADDALCRRIGAGSEPVGIYVCRAGSGRHQNRGRPRRSDGVRPADGNGKTDLRQVRRSAEPGPFYEVQLCAVHGIVSVYRLCSRAVCGTARLCGLRLFCGNPLAGNVQQSICCHQRRRHDDVCHAGTGRGCGLLRRSHTRRAGVQCVSE